MEDRTVSEIVSHEETVDLTPVFQRQQLQEGVHPIHTTHDGYQITANIHEGKITWHVTDAQGQEQHLVYIERVGLPPQRCRICIERLNKSPFCWILPFPCHLIEN